MVSLFVLIGGFGYGTYSYATQSIEKIESTYLEEENFAAQRTLRKGYKDFLAVYRKQKDSGSMKILPLEAQNAALFNHLSDVGEIYDVLATNFEIRNSSSVNRNKSIDYTEATTITFYFIGSRYNTSQFVSRIEEVTPLITIRDLTLLFDENQTTAGSITFETLHFNFEDEVSEIRTLPQDFLNTIPESLPSYNYLYDLKDAEKHAFETEDPLIPLEKS